MRRWVLRTNSSSDAAGFTNTTIDVLSANPVGSGSADTRW